MTDTARPRVVIIGGGFGGLATARALAGAPYDVILLDARNHHLFQPLLYQVATAALSPAEIAWPIRHLLRRQKNATVLMAEVDIVNVPNRTVHAGDLCWTYDHLVIAAGSRHSSFGNDHWAEHAPGLKTMDDAVDLRARVLAAFERAESLPHPSGTTFVVVGGGPTGVEMAGALIELARHALRNEFRRTDPAWARVVLIEAGPRLLSALPQSLSMDGQKRLEAMGVEVRLNTRVVECGPDGVMLNTGHLAAQAVVWAAGVQASDLISQLPCAKDPSGRAIVDRCLALFEHPEVRVIGDAASIRDEAGKPVPGIAPAAKQAGHFVGRTIAEALEGRLAGRPFRYRHAGNLATIGTGTAVVDLGRIHLRGWLGWMFWSIVHVLFMIGVRNRVAVALDWIWSGLTRQRAARLILGADVASSATTAASAP